MARFTGKEKVILFGVLWLAVGAAMVFGVVWPLYLRLESFPDRYEGAWYTLQDLETSANRFAATKAEFERISANIQLIRSQLLDPDQAVRFIEALENLAGNEQLYKEISLVNEPNPSKEGKDKSSFVFQLTTVGTYQHVMEFIANLENFTYAVDVEKVSLAPAKTGQIYTTGTETHTQGAPVFNPLPGDIASAIRIRVYAVP